MNACDTPLSQTKTISLSYKDSVLKDSLVHRIFEIRYKEPDQVKPVLEAIRALERRYDDDIADQNYLGSQVFLQSNIKKNPDSAAMFIDSLEAMENNGRLNAANLKAKIFYSRAIYFQGQEWYDSAISNALKALTLSRGTSDSVLIRNINGTISDLYAYQGNLHKASAYYKPIISEAIECKNPPRDAGILLNAYCRFAEGSDTVKELAVSYLFKAKKMIDSFGLGGLKPLLYTNLAAYYYGAGQADSGRVYAQLSLQEMEQYPSPNNRPELAYLLMVNNFIKEEHQDSAYLMLNEMLRKTDTAHYQKQDLKTFYQYGYLVAKSRGALVQSMSYLERYNALVEDMHEVENNRILLDYETKMAHLSNRLAIQKKEYYIKRQRNYVLFSTVLAVLMFGFAIFIFYYNRRKRLIEKQYWMLLQKRRESQYRDRLWEERNRISREMHDDLGSTLTSTIMAVEIAEQFPEQKEHLNIVRERSLNLHDKINEIIWNLNVQNDNVRSLNNYMFRFAKSFLGQADIRFHWEEQVEDENTVIKGFQRRALYLSFKEIIHNIVKHSRATEVYVLLRSDQHVYHLSVSDDGIGLGHDVDAGSLSARECYGIANIQRSIANLLGTVRWNPGKGGKGTEVAIDIEILI